MRVLLFGSMLAGVACFGFGAPGEQCFAAHTDTLGVLTRWDVTGHVAACVWLLNDSAYCRGPIAQRSTCVVGDTTGHP